MTVIEHVVDADYCIGCGLCAVVCPENALRMTWGPLGTFYPARAPIFCQDCPACLAACPFADGLTDGATHLDEDELGQRLLDGAGSLHDPRLGYYRACYAGYAPALRSDSSSGGLATWFLIQSLTSGLVDHVLCVHGNDSAEALFSYRSCTTFEEVRAGAKTRYYPVHVADVLSQALQQKGRYALVALPCTLKALRLAQRSSPLLTERVVFTVGLFCGGLKNAHFVEYLAACVGVQANQIAAPRFRVKNPASGAWDYSFQCSEVPDGTQMHSIPMRLLGDMWGAGLFKPNACDYCDDISAELADVSVGDAWIPPYIHDGLGTSIVVTRSPEAQRMLERGCAGGELLLEAIPAKRVIESQAGNFRHRREGLAYRLNFAHRAQLPVPRKRVAPGYSWNPIKSRIQRLRMRARRLSTEAWLRQRSVPGTQLFEQEMRDTLRALSLWTSIYHWPRWIGRARHFVKTRLARLRRHKD